MEIKNVAQTVQKESKQKLKESGEQVLKEVIDSLVSKELVKRKEYINQALSKIDTLNKELKGYKPDNVLYDEAGKEIQSGWSKQNLDSKNKIIAKIDSLNNALEKSLNEGDYSKLINLIK